MTARKKMPVKIECVPGHLGIGKVYPAQTMLFRRAAGKATGPDGTKYELSIDMGTAQPIVRSMKTEKSFTLSWVDILNLAVSSGINVPDRDDRRPLPSLPAKPKPKGGKKTKKGAKKP